MFNADIEKMYRQILVDPAQCSFQRILFRDSPSSFVRDYELKTVTFGVNCPPYLVIRTLLHDIAAAIRGQNELIAALQSAGLSLRKWTFNCKQILANLASDHVLNSDFHEFENSSLTKLNKTFPMGEK